MENLYLQLRALENHVTWLVNKEVDDWEVEIGGMRIRRSPFSLVVKEKSATGRWKNVVEVRNIKRVIALADMLGSVLGGFTEFFSHVKIINPAAKLALEFKPIDYTDDNMGFHYELGLTHDIHTIEMESSDVAKLSFYGRETFNIEHGSVCWPDFQSLSLHSPPEKYYIKDRADTLKNPKSDLEIVLTSLHLSMYRVRYHRVETLIFEVPGNMLAARVPEIPDRKFGRTNCWDTVMLSAETVKKLVV